ncbi:hypothetical protein LJ753_07420 [Arthrobacter sp. zg-Y20]|uniref:hypothetical protein n=1 Tax=unclassified Arthrobacter TaxID=235627 RepID=UPI001D13B121|nr:MULTISPECIES: hypothetical protein [unclassified Arthrobacter]MCC3275699.1 hypothetical protein [Arthrobacter sp. zg-Y20]MDK1315856.1 hypothetical protein [Arthrobacter sp. zg.Y20]WIB06359.1 hypothetical protein QNO06_01005 [Arthrobacter sp. zg-Y20]
MDEYVIVVETGYKMASAAHRMTFTEPMARWEATRTFLELMEGRHEDLLPARTDSHILEVSATEFLRVHQAMGGSVVLDRVTLTRKH